MEIGTRVSLLCGNGHVEPGVIVRTTREMLPLPEGCVPVLFYNGTEPLLVHVSCLTVVQDALSARNEIRRRRRVERAWRVA